MTEEAVIGSMGTGTEGPPSFVTTDMGNNGHQGGGTRLVASGPASPTAEPPAAPDHSSGSGPSPDAVPQGAQSLDGAMTILAEDSHSLEQPSKQAGRRTSGDSVVSWVGSVVTGIGIFLALFAAYLFLFTPFQASRAQHHLLSELRPPVGSTTLEGHVPPEGYAVAVINIPVLHLNQVVVEGTSASDLTVGPGLMPGSALPGTPGNTVIAGRRYLYGKPFAGLSSLKVDDTVQLVGAYGTFNYKVTSTREIRPGQSDPIAPTRGNQLTLVTSNSSLAPSDRVVTIARLIGAPVDVHVSKLGVPPMSERALSGDSSSILPAILWGILLLAAILLSVRLYRRWNHTWPTYIMTTPVVLALAILTFQDLAHLLPATL
ncbi:MAG: class D sortase [Acidimicrobiales bacterium]